MALLAIQTQGAVLTAQRGALVVRIEGQRVRRIPPHEVDEVHLYGDVELNAAARNLLLRSGIEVILLSARGMYLGRLVPSLGGQAVRRQAQYRWLGEEATALAFARAIVVAKLTGQRRVLKEVEDRPTQVQDALVALRRLRTQVGEASDIEVIRGVEGMAARLYYAGYAATLRHPELTMNGRSRRPPRDEVNACLSFCYMLMLRRVESAIRRSGLDVYLGALHGTSRGAPALALDLVEELRPVVDRMVRTLVNRRQLSPGDFESPRGMLYLGAEDEDDAGPGVHLAATGREVVLRALGAEWRRRVADPWGQGRVELTEALYRHAMRVSELFAGERTSYQPLELR